MEYEQNIPFYITKFRDYPWKIYESEHYIFHVGENSPADKEIEQIRVRQETAYTKIVQTLELKEPDQKIKYYFYPSQEKKAELMGDSWYGQSIYKEFEVHAVYNEQDKVVGEHEDTHLLSLQLGVPISLFQEGLAEAMVGKSMFGNEHNEVIKEGIRKGLIVDISRLMYQQGWLDTPDTEAEFYYSIAGSFTKYLLDTISLDTFKKLYASIKRNNSKEENIRIFKDIIGSDLITFEDGWVKEVVNIFCL